MAVFKRYRKQKNGSKVPYWYIRYWVNGEEKWEAVGKVGEVTKGVAQASLEERKRQIRLGQLNMIGAKVPTLEDFEKEYLAYICDIKQNRSAKRSRQALEHFINLFGGKKLNEINPESIDTYKGRRLKEEAKPATVNRELAVIKHLFNLARKWHKFFGDNPVSQSGLLEVHNLVERILTPEEEQRLLAVSPKYLQDIILIALNTGMRQGEILSLQWEWIDRENRIIALPQSNTKSKKTRKVPINPIVRKILLERKLQSGGSEFVFPSPKGLNSHLTWLKHSFKTACKKAGIENLRFHDLRHTAATRIIESRKGISLDAVKRLLGHSTIKVTERYSHPESSIQEAVEVLADFSLDRSQNRSQEESDLS